MVIENKAIKNSDKEPAKKPAKDSSPKVIVKACVHLDELGHYEPGQTFVTTSARAKALGKLVEIVKPEKPTKDGNSAE